MQIHQNCIEWWDKSSDYIDKKKEYEKKGIRRDIAGNGMKNKVPKA